MAASPKNGGFGREWCFGIGSSTEEAFMTFYSEVKQIERRDSVLTSENQIERLTCPGSSYFNLNPFEVLQIDPEGTDEVMKKKFLQLSTLVHPDKSQDDADRAQKASEAVDKACKWLLDQQQKKRVLDVIQEERECVVHTVKECVWGQLKKGGKPTDAEEDDPKPLKQAVYRQTMELFAELQIKRKERKAKEMLERKRQREEEIGAHEKARRESGRKTWREVGIEGTVGEFSRQIQRGRRRRRIRPSCSHCQSQDGSEQQSTAEPPWPEPPHCLLLLQRLILSPPPTPPPNIEQRLLFSLLCFQYSLISIRVILCALRGGGWSNLSSSPTEPPGLEGVTDSCRLLFPQPVT